MAHDEPVAGAGAVEDEALASARERAAGTLPLPSPELGALQRFLARLVGVRNAIEVGSAAGISGLWLLPGMHAEGTLTSIETDRNAHELATTAFAAAGFTTRVRAIVGDPAMVLPRLSDGGYDLLLAQGAPAGVPIVVGHAARLLRPGGLLVVCGPLGGDDLRTRVHEELVEDEAFTVVGLPLDGGTTLAARAR